MTPCLVCGDVACLGCGEAVCEECGVYGLSEMDGLCDQCRQAAEDADRDYLWDVAQDPATDEVIRWKS